MILIFIARLVLFSVDAVVYSIAHRWDGHKITALSENNVQSRRLYGRMIPVFLCVDLFVFILCLWLFPGLRTAIALWFLQPSSPEIGATVLLAVAPSSGGKDSKSSKWDSFGIPEFDSISDKSKKFEEALDAHRKIINGLIPLAGGRGLVRILLKVRRLIYAKAPSKSDVKICKAFAKSLWHLRSKSGPTFLLQYLKGCSVLLQQYVGRHRIPDPRAVGPAVSRTRAGLPRIIPRQQRLLIRRSDPKAIQFYLSIFNLYRVLDCKYKADPLKTIRHGSGLPVDHDFIKTAEYFLPVFFFSWLARWKKIDPNKITLELPKRGRFWQPFLVSKSTATLPGSPYQATSVLGILEAIYAWREHALLVMGKSMINGRLAKPNLKDKLLWQAFITWGRLVMPGILDLCGFKDRPVFVQQTPVTSPALSTKRPVHQSCVTRDGERVLYVPSAECKHPATGVCNLCLRLVVETGVKRGPYELENYGKIEPIKPEPMREDFMEPVQLVIDVRGKLSVRFAQAWKIFEGMWSQSLTGLISFKSLSEFGLARSGDPAVPPSTLESFVDWLLGVKVKRRYWNLARLIGLKEAAGKLRVIAIVDVITQWMLSPLHDMIFSILKFIPQDGTFDQEAPVHRLRKLLKSRSDKFAASYDLSAATDCLPLSLQKRVLAKLIGETLAEAWGNLLVARAYKYQPPFQKAEIAYYGVGQPMGALSSWASLAITHHFIVQWASWLSGRRTGWFTEYAVLGDDVVICNREVAKAYLEILNKLGVKVGLHKSIVSERGVMEFAKKFYSPTKVMTPVPIKELLVSEKLFPVFMNLIRKYPISIADLISLMGYRHRTLGNLHAPFTSLPKRVKTALITYLGPGSPGFVSFEHWLSSLSLVKRRPVDLDYHAILAYVIERVGVLKKRASLLARQPGHSLTWLYSKKGEFEEIEPYFKLLDKKAAWAAEIAAEEDRPLFNQIKHRILDPIALEEALKAHAIWEDLDRIHKEALKRFFMMSKEEILEMQVAIETLQERLYLVKVVDVQIKAEPDFRPDARRLVKLWNKLHKFDRQSGWGPPEVSPQAQASARGWEFLQATGDSGNPITGNIHESNRLARLKKDFARFERRENRPWWKPW